MTQVQPGRTPQIAVPDNIPDGYGVVAVKRNWADEWETTDYLEVLRVVEAASPGPSWARLRWRYGEKMWEDESAFTPSIPRDLVNRFVRVSLVTPWDEDWHHVWYGIVVDEEFNVHGSQPAAGGYAVSGDQFIMARGLEYLLDQARVSGARVLDGANLLSIDWCPPFNKKHPVGGTWMDAMGNRTESHTDDGCFAFSSTDANQWTNANIIEYVLNRYAPTSAACEGMSWLFRDDVGIVASQVGIHRFEHWSVRDAINALVDRRRGQGWKIESDGSTVTVRVFAMFEHVVAVAGASFAPNADVQDLLLDGDQRTKSMLVRKQHLRRAKRIRVEGARVKSCFSIDLASNILEEGWTAAEETTYKDGVGTDGCENDAFRRSTEAMRRVYCYFRVVDAWDWLSRSGDVAAPWFADDGRLMVGVDPNAWTGGKRFLPQLPIVDSSDASGVKFLPPLVFVAQPYDATKYLRLDRGYRDDVDNFAPVAYSMAPNEMGVWLRPSDPHAMAGNHWTDAAATNKQDGPDFDYETLIATVCVETDQRLSIVEELPDMDDEGPLHEVVISVPEAEYWHMAVGVVIGLDTDGTLLVRDSADPVRDDRELLRQVAALAKAWYGAPRIAIEATKSCLTTFAPVGTMIRGVQRQDVLGEINTVVTTRAWDFKAGTTSIRTGFAELDAVGMAMDSPGLPGPAAVARAVAQMRSEVDAMREEVAQGPIIEGADTDADSFEAVVTDDPPSGESIPNDEPVYAVKEVHSTDVAGDTADGITYGLVSNGRHLMAWNKGEDRDAHGLNETDEPTDDDAKIVTVRRLRDATAARGPRFFFRRSLAAMVAVNLTRYAVSDGSLSTATTLYEMTNGDAYSGERRFIYPFPTGGDGDTVGIDGSRVCGFVADGQPIGFVLLVDSPSPSVRNPIFVADVDLCLITEPFDPTALAWPGPTVATRFDYLMLVCDPNGENADDRVGTAEGNQAAVRYGGWVKLAGLGAAGTLYYGLEVRADVPWVLSPASYHRELRATLPDTALRLLRG